MAEFGTRFVNRCGTLATQVPEEEEKLSGGEGGIRIEIKMLLEIGNYLSAQNPRLSVCASRFRQYLGTPAVQIRSLEKQVLLPEFATSLPPHWHSYLRPYALPLSGGGKQP